MLPTPRNRVSRSISTHIGAETSHQSSPHQRPDTLQHHSRCRPNLRSSIQLHVGGVVTHHYIEPQPPRIVSPSSRFLERPPHLDPVHVSQYSACAPPKHRQATTCELQVPAMAHITPARNPASADGNPTRERAEWCSIIDAMNRRLGRAEAGTTSGTAGRRFDHCRDRITGGADDAALRGCAVLRVSNRSSRSGRPRCRRASGIAGSSSPAAIGRSRC